MDPRIGVKQLNIFLEELGNNVGKGIYLIFNNNFFSFFFKKNKNRFHNHLDPRINKERWTEEED